MEFPKHFNSGVLVDSKLTQTKDLMILQDIAREIELCGVSCMTPNDARIEAIEILTELCKIVLHTNLTTWRTIDDTSNAMQMDNNVIFL